MVYCTSISCTESSLKLNKIESLIKLVPNEFKISLTSQRTVFLQIEKNKNPAENYVPLKTPSFHGKMNLALKSGNIILPRILGPTLIQLLKLSQSIKS